MNASPSTKNVSLYGAASITPEGVSRAPLPLTAGRIGASSGAGAYHMDLRDHLVFPGLINAHEHLHVNAIPPLRAGSPFPNSYAWIAAFQAHFAEPAVIAALQVPKARRLRHGALKNLLAGITCVAHHDPWHPELDATDFPVALLRDFGWSYTLGGPAYGPPVQQSFASTSPDWPWLIHLAEGTDAVAQAELAELDRRGCLAANTVLIHGVGLSRQDIDRVIAAGAAVVWCPASNLALLGRTIDPRRLCVAGRLALGSDSRLSGERDLLAELRGVALRDELSPRQLLGLVTSAASRILRLPLHGSLAPGAHANLVIAEDRGGEEARSLVGIERNQIRAVVRDGVPQIADPDFADWFAAVGIQAVPVTLDGKPKLLAKALADPALIAMEPGLERVAEQRRGTCDFTSEARCH